MREGRPEGTLEEDVSLGCSEEGFHEPCPVCHSLYLGYKSQLPPSICHHFPTPAALLTGRVTSPDSQDGLCPCTRLPAHLQPGEIWAQAFTQAWLCSTLTPIHQFTLTLNFRGTHLAPGSDLLNTDSGGPTCHSGYLCPHQTLSPLHLHAEPSPLSFLPLA